MMKRILVIGTFGIFFGFVIGMTIKLVLPFVPEWLWAVVIGGWGLEKILNLVAQGFYQKSWWVEALINPAKKQA